MKTTPSSDRATIPPELETTLSKFESVVDKLQTSLEPLFEFPLADHLTTMNTLEKTKIEVLLTYAMNTLFSVYLKTQGVSPDAHPVQQELERIRYYLNKLYEADTTAHAEELTASNQLDLESTKRLIYRALGGEASKKLAEKEDSTNDRKPKSNITLEPRSTTDNSDSGTNVSKKIRFKYDDDESESDHQEQQHHSSEDEKKKPQKKKSKEEKPKKSSSSKKMTKKTSRRD